ncbi:C2H2 type zinc finger protein [Cordyceps fumosorosea ARSEF 2679]|uniref:C2H2 type zinc finger protein n=1 Tax=Cordyceps fumosorosea (strain ARSEF 2679) TaxID=1081104 RepID=A0A167WPL5_CORFA|nr:C2H2 type zinc finger protein [Cordyceps fumosorosea ARSEF 2679]OAA64054.1 C2H2 type zinc finger protein [Cordyceps fumosorosea ARSEF 2679]
MDHQSSSSSQDGQSSAAAGQPVINRPHSPSPSQFAPTADSNTVDLVSLDQSSLTQQTAQQPFAPDSSFDSSFADSFLTTQHQSQSFPADTVDPPAFDPSASFAHQPTSGATSLPFTSPSQQSFLAPNIADGDFSLFPSTGSQADFNAPLFEPSSFSPADLDNMASPQSQHSPSSAHHSPSFAQHHQFSSPNVHSRNVSLGPEAALMPGQLNEWSGAQFTGHRRAPSEYSDVSSVTHSPNLNVHDSFDDGSGHSPLQRPSDGSMYQEVLSIGAFNLGDGRSPSHSPAISPRIGAQPLPDMQYQAAPNPSYNIPAYPTIQDPSGTFVGNSQDMPQMAPAINIDFAPANNAKLVGFDATKSQLDQDSLLPPDRGRPKSRPRSVTDPFQPGAAVKPRPSSVNATLGSNLAPRQEVSRSLSPGDRQSSAARRRQSTSAVPNNVIALRLADPEYQGGSESGGPKRVQKHPATFQCTLCPKRFTRAYNLRSHLRTHTDERPFVCTVCGKAFARQHDRKRHESLHSGEKKFVCKGELKAGGQWGCGRRFARADALGRHFRSEAGRICIKPLLDEEMIERQRQWQEQRMQQDMAMTGPGMAIDANTGYPVDNNGNYALPAALLAQYPALAGMNWSAPEMAGMEDDLSGRSSFDASDYDDGEDGGYMSGPGTGYGEGGMSQNFGEVGYSSDMGGR